MLGGITMLEAHLRNEALNLSDIEKIELVETLQDSINQPSPETEALWARESEARYQLYTQGKIEPAEVSDVIQKYSL